MTTHTRTRPVGVEELRRAWLAVQAGQYRRVHPHGVAVGPTQKCEVEGWAPAPDEVVVPLIGATGSCGATTVALALATCVGGSSRVVECASPLRSGLAAASTAELGADDRGWLHGSRDHVQLARCDSVRPSSATVPPPATATPTVTVVDVGSEVERILAGSGWLTQLLTTAPKVVVVTRATLPGLRRLEAVVHLLSVNRVIAAVVGPPRRRWPRQVTYGLGDRTRALIQAGRLVKIPEDRGLAITGLTPDPLPRPLLSAAGDLLRLIEGSAPHAR